MRQLTAGKKWYSVWWSCLNRNLATSMHRTHAWSTQLQVTPLKYRQVQWKHPTTNEFDNTVAHGQHQTECWLCLLQVLLHMPGQQSCMRPRQDTACKPKCVEEHRVVNLWCAIGGQCSTSPAKNNMQSILAMTFPAGLLTFQTNTTPAWNLLMSWTHRDVCFDLWAAVLKISDLHFDWSAPRPRPQQS